MKPFKTLLIPLIFSTFPAFSEEITIATPVFPEPEHEKQVEFVEPTGLPEVKASANEQSHSDAHSKNNANEKPTLIVLDKNGKQVDITNLNKSKK